MNTVRWTATSQDLHIVPACAVYPAHQPADVVKLWPRDVAGVWGIGLTCRN